MATIINQAAFDIIWVQFYNNDGYGCSAINYTTQGSSSNFNLNSGATNWVSTLASGASKNAKLYIGLPGGPEGVANNPQDWLTPAEAQALINEFQDTTNFGGVMLWEATAAAAVQMDNYAGYTQHAFYWDAIKAFLNPYAPATTAATSICLSSTSTSSSSTSTSQSSTLTTSSSSLTSSSSSSTIKSTSKKPCFGNSFLFST
jgi:chitinase